MRQLLLATHNEHKRRELARLLAARPGGGGWEVIALPADVTPPPEPGSTVAQNATGKARAGAEATGADDGPARRRAEGRDQPPRPRRARAAGVAHRRLMAAETATARPRPA